MKSVVVTGAKGFLGQYIASWFTSHGWNVVGVDRGPPQARLLQTMARFHSWNLPDPRWGTLLRELAPDLCIHCAGSASVPLSFADPARDYYGGPALVFELLDMVRRDSPRTGFVFLSSAAVYGNPCSLPVQEDHPTAAISPYGLHKWQSEQLCHEYATFFGLATASLRIFSAYGRGLRRQVVWDVCNKLLHASTPILQGTGNETRDFIHGQDVAQAAECVARRAPLHGESYNVASGLETSIAELSYNLTRMLEHEGKVCFSGTLPQGTPVRWRADINRLEALGFRQKVGLLEGLRDFVAWVREEQIQPSASLSA
jgi:UDP-glucose 4-epimerase